MPSPQDAEPTPCPRPDATPAGATALPAFQLAQASRALWMATLSLMTAYMQNTAPAHRLLLARRISRNFDTLARLDCFDTGCRASFTRLAHRWRARAEPPAPAAEPARTGLLRFFS
jgi:hypothetical protein